MAEMGIETIVSTDDASPNVKGARKHGLRYVHIPIGYDGIDEEAQAAMALTLKTYEGGVYIHCHHGKHRGPAMAAIAVLLEEAGDKGDAIHFMERAHTSPDYEGLWQSVSNFDREKLTNIEVVLHERVPLAPIVEEMAAISRIVDRLEASEAANWKTPPSHPDVSPAREAIMIAERFRELVRHGDFEYEAELEESERLGWKLRDAIAAGDSATASEIFNSMKQSCGSCHDAHRN